MGTCGNQVEQHGNHQKRQVGEDTMIVLEECICKCDGDNCMYTRFMQCRNVKI